MKFSIVSGLKFRQLFQRVQRIQLFHPFQRIGERVRAWSARRKAIQPFTAPSYLHFPLPYTASIHRDVTPNGVRVYCLCGECGSRLSASATLCEDCAQKRSRPARPY